MPDLGGLDLVDEFRLLRPGMPIVLMTAQGSLEAAVEAVSRGATDFIGKPFDIADIVKLLRRYLEARREADANSGRANRRKRFLALRFNRPQRAHGDGLQTDRAGRLEPALQC